MQFHFAVHPHLRGAYRPVQSKYRTARGSSPHAWGILLDSPPVGWTVRFIPTYVGHTWGLLHHHYNPPVHPHIRGAYFLSSSFFWSRYGSSPHTWGIRPQRPPFASWRSVHPHIRGAYHQLRVEAVDGNGSSPHTWGIHWTAVRKMAGFSHFSYDFTRKSYFVQGLVFFGVIGAEAFPTHRRGRNQCLPGAHGGSVRNL